MEKVRDVPLKQIIPRFNVRLRYVFLIAQYEDSFDKEKMMSEVSLR